MIRVTIEMIPKGDNEKAYILAQGIISNDGTGNDTTGNYIYGLTAQAKDAKDEPPITRSGRYLNFSRNRYDVWELLRRCLNNGNQNLITSDGTQYGD